MRAAPLTLLLLALPATVPAQAPDRSRPPEPGPPPALRLPPVQQFRLSNGLPVLLLEKHNVPLVQVNVFITAGAVLDPAGKPGTASMTAAMLDEGAGPRDALALADAIDYLGARITAGAGHHSTVIALHTPRARLDSALVLVADVALRPRFAPEELERQRRERLTMLTQWRDQPPAIAAAGFSQVLYGADHPYGVPVQGTAASVRGLTVADLQAFHAAHFRPANAALVVVGDVTLAELRPALEARFGGWRGDAAPRRPPPAPQPVRRRTVTLVDKPGAEQTQVRIGFVGPSRDTDDFYALTVMNTILGGAFTSRLNQNLREDKGYSYGAYSRFDFRPQPGPFLAAAAVQTEVTDKAVAEFMKELRGITRSVTDEELDRARTYVALQFPQNFQQVADIAGEMGDMVLFGLPPDYFNQFVTRVQQVTRADVERVARKYMDPERVAIVLVGDRATIETGVRALGLGPLRVLAVDDVLGAVSRLP
jgi:predicted Zn-dependent peptidase